VKYWLVFAFCGLALLAIGLFSSISPMNMDAGFLYAQF
jgi:hypothetical protein